MRCRGCGEDVSKLLEHVVECEHIPEGVRREASRVLESRKVYAQQPIMCCKARKKIILVPHMLSEEVTGIPDSEMADHMTFERTGEHDVVRFNFCPWCGKPWVVGEINVL